MLNWIECMKLALGYLVRYYYFGLISSFESLFTGITPVRQLVAEYELHVILMAF